MSHQDEDLPENDKTSPDLPAGESLPSEQNETEVPEASDSSETENTVKEEEATQIPDEPVHEKEAEVIKPVKPIEQAPTSRKKSKKIFWILIVLFLLGGGWLGYQLLNPDVSGPRINPLSLVPGDALFVMESDKPYKAWAELNKTQLWNILKKDGEWKEYGEQLEELESSLSDFDLALDLLTNREIYLSAHRYRRSHLDYLFIVDLGGLGVVRTWLTRSDQVTKREFQGNTIYEKLDTETKETLYFTFEDNFMVGSYTHTLVENSIREKTKASFTRSLDFIDIKKKVLGDGLVRLYLNYPALYAYLETQLSAEETDLLKAHLPLIYSGLFFDVEPEAMLMEGYSNYYDSLFTYLNLFPEAGTGGLEIAGIAPSRTSAYFSLGFDSFADFYEALKDQLSNDPEYGESYTTYTRRTEKFLDISLKEDLASWIDDEIAMLQVEPENASSDVVLVFKAKSPSLLKEKMGFLNKQIKRKTPVRFKAVDYKGYAINFMSVKGFFNLILGKLFQRFDRPYYAIIDEFIVFANEPSILRMVIDDYINEQTLAQQPSFQHFKKKLGEDHSGLLYLQLPLLERSENGLLDNDVISFLKSRNNILKNFPHLVFKISPDDKMFKTKLMLSVKTSEALKAAKHEPEVALDTVNYDSLWQLDPGDQIEIADIEIEDLGAKKQVTEDEDGNPHYEVELKDGLKNGNYFEYHPTGELKIKGKYKNDLKEGVWKYYDENGKQIKKERYRKGELIR